MAAPITPLSPAQLSARLAAGEPLVLLDVREDHELALAALPGAVHIPMGEISLRRAELDSGAAIVVMCHHGIRSMQVARYLLGQDFIELYNLSGGIDAWSLSVDPAVPRY